VIKTFYFHKYENNMQEIFSIKILNVYTALSLKSLNQNLCNVYFWLTIKDYNDRKRRINSTKSLLHGAETLSVQS
jgi:hypothetical protein